ncbi:MAG: signal recognition particle-docking protein FtsY [Pseudobacteriovorax sp.]|nr:signal recognition particle-docking protein FtsY [Pseudobacteriovorax sp.]
MKLSDFIEKYWSFIEKNNIDHEHVLLALAVLGLLIVGFIIRAFIKKSKLNKTTIQKVESQTTQKLRSDTPQAQKPVSPKVPIEPVAVAEPPISDRKTWLSRLHSGLSKTRDQFANSLSQIIQGKGNLDSETLEDLHEILFRADLGVETADLLIDDLRDTFKGTDSPQWEDVRNRLKIKAEEILSKNQNEANFQAKGPTVVLIVGVNGVGKTTSIGKLAAQYMSEGKSVLLCAADTYRAAAIEQLETWSNRIGCDIVKHKQGSDPASVAFDGVKAAIARNVDALLIDTAGRLHNKKELMDELGKIKRVLGKDLPEAPHETWLAIDATTGQNAYQQVGAFSDVASITGLIVTKLDGTAKGGVVVGVSNKYGIPIRYIGVGEKAADLREFNPKDFSASLF